ncbi:hypothetical protein GCM10009422_17050 [Brevundimonas kwangchunensis]|uniref:Uncharacterized protein n=1 Tax=Brevundimonas kwangchunensis TaxID=322163 RepID=A0ABN1GWG9_9CAUL
MFLTLAAALALLPQQIEDPLAPAREGKLMCVSPNTEAKTCSGLVTYSFEADGAIVTEARTAVSAAPPIVLLTRTPMHMRGALECSRTDDFASQITGVEIQGQALAGDQLNGMRQIIGAQAQQMLGTGEMCAAYHSAADDKVRYEITMEGVAKPELGGEILWIDANAGWTVAI